MAFQAESLSAPPRENAVSEKQRIGRLVSDLGHSEYTKRVSAIKLLAEIGEVALPALRAAAHGSNDQEVKFRAKQAIVSIFDRAKRSRSTGLELVVIKPGKFLMGSLKPEPGRRPDERSHSVQITKPFLMGKYEVTQGQYEKVMKYNPSGFRRPDGKRQRDEGGYPVEQVTWYDAIEFCNRLSKQDGFRACYELKDVKYEGKSIVSAKVAVNDGNGYRLPTEAEWEYACRASTTTPFFFGKRNTGKQSNVKAEKRKGAYGLLHKAWKDRNRTTPVGSYPANLWGLHDTLGNVAEWVNDWYDKDFNRDARISDPTGPVTGRHRVLRGGSWLLTESHARSASRFYLTPDERKNYVGIRVARTP